MKSRKKYTAAFKSQVALAAIKGDETIAALAQKYELHPTQINLWKKEALEGFSQIFEKPKPAAKKEEGAENDYLERKIGQLTIEIDFLKKKYEMYLGKSGGK
ncbi:MAG: transposase [Alphaproteobacteria bacterium]|nr:transposase [Alphaproteobacteria bacterium]